MKASQAPDGLEIALVVLGAACFAASIRTLAGAACFLLSLLLLVTFSRLAIGDVLRRLRPFLIFGALAVAFGGMGPGEPTWRLGPLAWSREAGVEAAVAALRLVGLGTVAVWIDLSAGPARLVAHLLSAAGLFRRLGIDLSPLLAGAAVALRFLPLLQVEAVRMRLGWEARGAALLGRGPLARALYARGIAVPLLAATLRRAQHLAEAIETRGGKGIPEGMSLEGRSGPRKGFTSAAALRVASIWLPWFACWGTGWR